MSLPAQQPVPNYPSDFGSNQTPPTYDYDEVYLLSSALFIGGLGFVIYLLSSEARKTRRFMHACALFLGGFGIIAGLVGGEWATAKIGTRTQYRAGYPNQIISAYVGIRVHLDGFNVTLEGSPQQQLGETINYNEYFSWKWHQHYDETNKYGGKLNQVFKESQVEGIPYPIQWVAQYLRLDGENVRWGRYYRQAGYFCWILLWFSFSLWVVAAVMMFVQIAKSEIMLFCTGLCCHLAVSLFFGLSRAAPLPLRIPFADGVLELGVGWVPGVVAAGALMAEMPFFATLWCTWAEYKGWFRR